MKLTRSTQVGVQVGHQQIAGSATLACVWARGGAEPTRLHVQRGGAHGGWCTLPSQRRRLRESLLFTGDGEAQPTYLCVSTKFAQEHGSHRTALRLVGTRPSKVLALRHVCFIKMLAHERAAAPLVGTFQLLHEASITGSIWTVRAKLASLGRRPDMQTSVFAYGD